MAFLRFLLVQLTTLRPTLWGFAWRVALVHLGGSILFVLVGTLVAGAVGDRRTITASDVGMTTPVFVTLALLLVIATPLVETFLLWLGLAAIRRFLTTHVLLAAMVSGLAWGVLHALTNNIQNGFAAAWGFFCLTLAFQTGEQMSLSRAYWSACLPHILINAVATMALLAEASG